MKIIINILLTLSIMIVFYSCSKNSSDTLDEEARGVMEIEIIDRNGEGVDEMGTVRFFVFKNASHVPELELNQLFVISDLAGNASRLGITLEMSRKLSGVNDKMVVAIVNEPSNMTNELNDIWTYEKLQNMELQFADFLNANHTSLQDDKTMPMTGVIWTDKVYATPEEAEADPMKMNVLRTAARVDVYIRKENNPELDFTLATGTNITLNKTFNKEYLVRGTNGTLTFGKIQTVESGLVSKTWTLSNTESKELPYVTTGSDGRFLCSFYTPERTCRAANNADKLILNIYAITSEGSIRRGEIIVDHFEQDGVKKSIEVIERNNIYKIVATIRTEDITATINDWSHEVIETEF